MKIQFKETNKSQTAEVQNGEYSRHFDRGEQPFDVTDEEWKVLRRTGLFEPVKDVTPEQPEGDPPAAQPQRAKRKAQAQPIETEENLSDGLSKPQAGA